MNTPKLTDNDYIQFLIAAQRVYTCPEAARCPEVASHGLHTPSFKTAARYSRELPPSAQAMLRHRASAGAKSAGAEVLYSVVCTLLSVRAFVRLEAHRLKTGISGYAAKAGFIREAIRLYLQQPTILLEPTV